MHLSVQFCKENIHTEFLNANIDSIMMMIGQQLGTFDYIHVQYDVQGKSLAVGPCGVWVAH